MRPSNHGLRVDLIQFEQTVVEQAMILEVTPDILHRAQLRCVRRKPLDREPWIGRPQQLDLGTAMSAEPIPHENDVAPKMGRQVTQE